MDKLTISDLALKKEEDPEDILKEYYDLNKEILDNMIYVNKLLKKQEFIEAFSQNSLLEDLYARLSKIYSKFPKNFKINNEKLKIDISNINEKLDAVLKENLRELEIEKDVTKVTNQYLGEKIKDRLYREKSYDKKGKIYKSNIFKKDASIGIVEEI